MNLEEVLCAEPISNKEKPLGRVFVIRQYSVLYASDNRLPAIPAILAMKLSPKYGNIYIDLCNPTVLSNCILCRCLAVQWGNWLPY